MPGSSRPAREAPLLEGMLAQQEHRALAALIVWGTEVILREERREPGIRWPPACVTSAHRLRAD